MRSASASASVGHVVGTEPPASSAAVTEVRHSGPSAPPNVAGAGSLPVSTANGTRCHLPWVSSTVPLPSGRSTTAHRPLAPGPLLGLDLRAGVEVGAGADPHGLVGVRGVRAAAVGPW